MHWIDLSGRERLFQYAENFAEAEPSLFSELDGDESSFFSDASERSGAPIQDIESYEPITIATLRENLQRLWQGTHLVDMNLLIKIIIAATMDNEPCRRQHTPRENSHEEAEPDQPDKIEPMQGSAPAISELQSAFVYEF